MNSAHEQSFRLGPRFSDLCNFLEEQTGQIKDRFLTRCGPEFRAAAERGTGRISESALIR